MARVLIAGCGYVGSALGTRLAAEGHEVWGLRRDASALPDAIRPVSADLTVIESLGSLPVGIEVVFYTAAGSGGDEEGYRRVYLDGIGRLLDALVDQGEKPRRVVFTSSTSVYAQKRGEWVDENSHAAPTGFRGDILLCGERLLLSGPFPATVLRLGGIYGPGRDRLVRAVAAGQVRIRAGEPHYTNRIHRDDAAGALAHLMSLDDPEDVYLGVDHEPAEEGEVLTWLAEQMGVAAPPRAEEGETGVAPVVRRSGSKRCRNTRLVESGYRFLYPTFREGYASLIRNALARSNER